MVWERKEEINKEQSTKCTLQTACKFTASIVHFIKMQIPTYIRGKTQQNGEDSLNLVECITLHPGVGKQRAKARSANFVYRNVLTVCFPCRCVFTRPGSDSLLH